MIIEKLDIITLDEKEYLVLDILNKNSKEYYMLSEIDQDENEIFNYKIMFKTEEEELSLMEEEDKTVIDELVDEYNNQIQE